MFDTRDLFEDSDLFKEKFIKKSKSQAGYYPKRGGLISSLVMAGKEILYLDEKTLTDGDSPVRGGIPVLFPNAGELKSVKFPKLSRHGFARHMEWLDSSDEVLELALYADQSTRNAFPYNFELSLHGSFTDKSGNSFSIKQSVKNLENKKTMPVSMGLHPYFKVSSSEKKNIKFNFPGGEVVAAGFKEWSNGGTIYIPNPGTPMEVEIPGLGTLILEASAEYKRIWVWSEKGKDFICIEPVMGDPGVIVEDPTLVPPGKTLTAVFIISLKK